MGEEESVLDAILEEDGFGNMEDVEMADAEEGEIMEHNLQPGERQGGDGDADGGKNSKPKRNKKKKKKQKRQPPKAVDIDRFVMDTCRRLKEKKSYMVYTAVGCLGVSALSDLLNEVEAVQDFGGQMTADGCRFRTGGGILWNIVKARQPAAYREIMKKTREFEKQFRFTNSRKKPGWNQCSSSEGSACASIDEGQVSDLAVKPVIEQTVSEGNLGVKPVIGQAGSERNFGVEPGIEQKESERSLGIKPVTKEAKSEREERKSVHERIRVPVKYDDLFGDEPLTAS